MGDTLESAPPRIDGATASALVHRHYGIRATATPFACERDATFRLTAADGQSFTLKISNPAEAPLDTNFQTKAMLWVAQADPGLPVPRVLPADDGRYEIPVQLEDGGTSGLRLLTWLVGMPAEQSRAACALVFGGVLERFPRLKVMLAHGGGSFPYTIGRIEHGFNMRPDLVATDNPHNPRDYLRRLYFDSCVHDGRALRYLIDTVGLDRIMLGTDYPFPLGEQEPGSGIRGLALGEDADAQVFHRTALSWLGLDVRRFAP